LARDVNNMSRYYGLFAPQLLQTHFAEEIWTLYQEGDLLPETELTGYFEEDTESANVDSVLEEIKAAMEEEQERLERIQAADEE